MKYKCIEDFEVCLYDEDCSLTDEMMFVEKGSIWSVDEDSSYNYIGGKDAIHLTLETEEEQISYWIELELDTVKRYFVEINF